jgi:hypothetical protein
MKDRFPVWNPADIKRTNEASRGGKKKWKKNMNHVKREIMR